MKSHNASTENKGAHLANGILVVDDDPLICELIRDVLESAEIKSRTTSDSQQASILIRERVKATCRVPWRWVKSDPWAGHST